MMKAYTIIKQEIEALFGVQGVILRICLGAERASLFFFAHRVGSVTKICFYYRHPYW